MIRIQKYRAKIKGTDEIVVGFLSEARKYIGDGCYSNNEKDILISVNETTMKNGRYGTFIVEKDTIEIFHECPVCKISEQKKEYNYLACSNSCYDKL